jgi:hypothetical protein
MSNDTNDNLPDAIIAALRGVPAVDPSVREANIEAALGAFDAAAEEDRGGSVTVMTGRRRPGLAAAAALLLVLGAGAGWAARGSGDAPTVMSTPSDTAARAQTAPGTDVPGDTVPPVKSGAVEVPGSPVRPESGLPCASETDGALYLGQYLRDRVLHIVFVSDFTIEVLRADTCEVLAAFQQPVAPAP